MNDVPQVEQLCLSVPCELNDCGDPLLELDNSELCAGVESISAVGGHWS